MIAHHQFFYRFSTVILKHNDIMFLPETLNPVIKLYIDKHNTPITSNFKLNRQSSGTSVHS